MMDDKQKVVLVVDDTPENIDVAKEILSSRYKVKAALSGEKGLEICFKKPPDLILLDVMMPDMDGYEVCRYLKNDENTNNIPIILITGISELDEITKGLELGANDYMTKPISASLLLKKVEKYI